MAAINCMTFLKGLILSVLLLMFSMTVARGEDYVTAQGYIHSFNNNLSVDTGVFALNKDLSLDADAYLKYTVDIKCHVNLHVRMIRP